MVRPRRDHSPEDHENRQIKQSAMPNEPVEARPPQKTFDEDREDERCTRPNERRRHVYAAYVGLEHRQPSREKKGPCRRKASAISVACAAASVPRSPGA